VKLPEPSENVASAKAPKAALIMIVTVLAGMLIVAIYANVQRWRRDQIETVIVTPVPTPTSSPATAVTP
jgi:cell division septal protein FtsQ